MGAEAAPLSMQSSHAGFDSDVISTAGVAVPLVAALSVSVCRDLTAGARLEFRSGPVGTMRVPESGQHLAVDVRATVIDVALTFLRAWCPFVCFGCDLRQWRRGACRGDYNTTSAGLSMA